MVLWKIQMANLNGFFLFSDDNSVRVQTREAELVLDLSQGSNSHAYGDWPQGPGVWGAGIKKGMS